MRQGDERDERGNAIHREGHTHFVEKETCFAWEANAPRERESQGKTHLEKEHLRVKG